MVPDTLPRDFIDIVVRREDLFCRSRQVLTRFAIRPATAELQEIEQVRGYAPRNTAAILSLLLPLTQSRYAQGSAQAHGFHNGGRDDHH